MAELKIKADSGGGTVSFKGPATTTSNAAVQLTLPVDDGAANQYLKTDGSGALSWATVTDTTVGGATGVDFNDSIQARFGTGTDFKILHDGTDSYLDHSLGSGLLRINAAAGSEIRLTKSGPETIAKFIPDGACELYYDNSKKLETSSTGVTVTGNVKFADGDGITLGTDDDVKIYQSGTDTVFKKLVNGALQFNHSLSSATTGIPWRFDKTNNSTSNNERHNMFSFGLPGVNRGLAQCGSSNSEAPQWAASSDYRIKENFRAYTGGWDAIKAIPVQLYDEKSPSYWTQGADKKNMKGWKAHEVQAVIPEAVTGTKDAVVTQALIDAGQYQQSELNHIIPQQLGTASMIPDVIGALQQAMAKIETLETKVAALEAG